MHTVYFNAVLLVALALITTLVATVTLYNNPIPLREPWHGFGISLCLGGFLGAWLVAVVDTASAIIIQQPLQPWSSYGMLPRLGVLALAVVFARMTLMRWLNPKYSDVDSAPYSDVATSAWSAVDSKVWDAVKSEEDFIPRKPKL